MSSTEKNAWGSKVINYYNNVINQFLQTQFKNNPKLHANFKFLTSLDPKTQFQNQNKKIKDPLVFLDLKSKINSLRSTIKNYFEENSDSHFAPWKKKFDIGKRSIVEAYLKDLKNKTKFDQFNHLRKPGDLITAHWLSSQHLLSQDLLSPNPPIQKKGTKLAITWPILVDSIVRDYEILNQLIFAPGLDKDPKKTEYHILLEEFFKNEGKLKYELTSLCLKPWVRHRLVHYKFAIDYFEKKINLFQYFSNPRENLKTVSIQELEQICGHLNTIVLVFLIAIWDLQAKNGHNYSFIPKDYEIVLSQIRSHRFFPFVKNMAILQNNIKNYTFLFQDSPSPQGFAHQRQIWQIFETFKRFVSYTQLKIPPILEQYGTKERTLYLTGYELVKHRIIIPMLKIEGLNIDFSDVSDKELVDHFRKIGSGKYEELIENFKPILRNDLAHINYYTKKERPTHIITQNGDNFKKKKEIVPGLFLFSMYLQFEEVFNEDSGKFLLSRGLAQLYQILFFKDISNYGRNYFSNQAILLKKYSQEQELMILCYLAESVNLLSQPESEIINAIDYIKKADQIAEKFPSKGEIGWAWIFAFKHKLGMELKKKWISLMFQHYSSLPGTSKAIGYVYALKSFIYRNILEDPIKEQKYDLKAKKQLC